MRRVRPEGGVRFVPLGAFPEATLQALAAYYRDKYGLAIDLAPSLSVPPAAFDAARGQLDSEVLVGILQAAYPQRPGERLIVIGFVADDMYIPDFNWRYALSYRKADRYAVVSSARMDRGCLGLTRASPERTHSRLRK